MLQSLSIHHFIPFASFRLSVCGCTHWRLCDYYYYNYLRLSHSFTRNCVSSTHRFLSLLFSLSLHHASELILFEDDIVRMLPFSVCSKQTIKINERKKRKKKIVDLTELKSYRKVETDCIRLALECRSYGISFFSFCCFSDGSN